MVSIRSSDKDLRAAGAPLAFLAVDGHVLLWPKNPADRLRQEGTVRAEVAKPPEFIPKDT